MPVREKQFRFGPFQLDTQCGQLRKDGIGLKLQGQPMQILQFLLEKPGQLFPRDEIRQRLWPSDTFVDFDQSLNTAIRKLRQALGDEADTPRYIETLPKRGYRFIGDVQAEQAGDADREPRYSSSEVNRFASADQLASVSDGHALIAPRIWLSRYLAPVVAFVAVLTVVGVFLLWRSAQQQRTAPVTIVQFTSLPGYERRPSFSPDGTQIMFEAGHPELDDIYARGMNIYVKAVGDEKVVRLTDPPGISASPQWSPDGRTIAYERWSKTSEKEFEHAIFLMTPLGGAKHKLREVSESWDGLSSWSPDSKKLAYGDKPPGEPSGIFLIPAATGSLRERLTTAPEGMLDSAPSFSPDGKELAFIRARSEGAVAELHLASLPARSEQKLATLDRMVGPIAWTSDSKRIIFSIFRFFDGNSSLYAIPVSGGKPERLQIISSDASSAAISRQGDKLAYKTAFLDSNVWKLSLVDDSPATQLIASTKMDMQPSYSPDGQRLAYVSDRDGTISIWTSTSDGKDQSRFASFGACGGTPVWSPNGKQLAFDSNDGSRWDILLSNGDGTHQTRLTNDNSDHRGPSWSADGKSIYFSSDRSGRWEIWKISVGTRISTQLTSQGGAYAQESPDGKFIYYQKPQFASEIYPLPLQFWRMPVAGGPEELVWRSEDPHATLSWFWRVTRKGIYFVDNSAKPNPSLRFLDMKTRTARTLRQLEKYVWGGPGLAISPDEQTALITQIDSAGSDIMIVQNFR